MKRTDYDPMNDRMEIWDEPYSLKAMTWIEWGHLVAILVLGSVAIWATYWS